MENGWMRIEGGIGGLPLNFAGIWIVDFVLTKNFA